MHTGICSWLPRSSSLFSFLFDADRPPLKDRPSTLSFIHSMPLRSSPSNSSLASSSSKASLRSSKSSGSLRSRGSRGSTKSSASLSASLASSSSVVTVDMGALRRQFDEFDKDGSGFLERQECVAALAKLGSKLTLQDVDKDGDNRISYEEVSFAHMLSFHSHTQTSNEPHPPALQPPSSQKSVKTLHPCGPVYFGHPALGDARIPDLQGSDEAQRHSPCKFRSLCRRSAPS